MKLKIQLSTYRELNEILPPWYYGYAYREWRRTIDVYMIMPFNFFLRWARHLKYTWNKFRGKPSIIDKLIAKEKRASWEEGYKYAEHRINDEANRIYEKAVKMMEMIEK